MEPDTRTQDELRRQIADLRPWFHNLRIGGIETAPDHFLGDYPSFKWKGFRHVVPEDLGGCSVLDIGCNAGFYSFEMKRRNAGRVVGVDTDLHYLRQAKFAARHQNLEIEFYQMSVYEVEKLETTFDFVLFMGVLYHLRYPLLALDLLRQHVVGHRMLFQCMQRGDRSVLPLQENYDFAENKVFDRADFPKLYFIENRYADDPTNWFIPNKAAMEAMLRSAGFEILQNPDPEVYLVACTERHDAVETPPALRLF